MSCHAQQLQVLLLSLSSSWVIQIIKQSSIRERIVESHFPVRDLHRPQLGLRKCDSQVLTVPVLCDPVLMYTLRNHDSTSLHSPCQDRLWDGGVLDFGQGDPCWVVQNTGEIASAIYGVEVGEGRVGDDLDALADVPGDEIRLLEVWVSLKFVGRRADLSVFEELFDLVLGEVRDADVLGVALFDELFHGVPGVNEVDLGCKFAVVYGDRPVHQVEVEIFDTEVREGLLDGWFDEVGVVLFIDKFAGKPNFIPGYARQLKALSDFFFVA